MTGGEPLVRRHVEDLVEQLAQIEGVADLTMTTNGSLLTHEKARSLKLAGLHRVTISLDSLDDAVFMAMNDAGVSVDSVLRAVDAAEQAGLLPIKINMVVKRGVNDSSILDMAARFRHTGHVLRFIEYMDVGNTNGWRMDDVVSAADIIRTISAVWPLQPIAVTYYGEVAGRWQYADGAGEIGVIGSVTQPFCGTCTRARLSPEGLLYTCLFASAGHDLRALVRGGCSDDQIQRRIEDIWRVREDRYSEIRSAGNNDQRKVEMSHIGG